MSDNTVPENIPLAIIGMGCRLPGADDLDQYWKLLIEGRSAVAELPPDRLDQKLYFDPKVGTRGKTYSKLGAIISSRQFNRAACPIPDELARSVDNAHLLMCEVAVSALRHAGMDPFQLDLRNTGVYIGHAQGSNLGGDYTYATCIEEAAEFLREVPDFQTLPSQAQDEVTRELVQRVRSKLPRRSLQTPDVSASMVAGTITKALGLTGPFVAINSACASSLQAMLLGARALQLGRVDMAVVGGASDCKSDSLVLFSNARAMSATGSRPFDSDADGLVCGEGYVALVMKTLDRALADGDRVLAVVRGLGVSSDGKGKSLWAPRKEGQTRAMERAYRGGVEMSGLQYLEAHATATQLGDATELNTLMEILSSHFPAGHKIPLTSVKANIGHTLETAGIAGVIKAVLAMQHEVVPPAINIQRLNPNIDWEHAPVYVPTKPVAWPAPPGGEPRRAGVNAFGIGGLNMHVVLDEFTESARRLSQASPGPARALSAKDPEAVAVVGLGCVLPGAGNVSQYWDLLASGRDPKCQVPEDRWRPDLSYKPNSREAFRSPSTLGGFITDFEYDWRRHKVPPKQVQQADPLQFMLLDAADQAMADAGYDSKPFDRERVGVVVGTEFGGDFAFQLQLGLRLPELQLHIEQILTGRGFTPDRAQQVAQEYAEALLKHWPALIDETGSFSTSSLASRISKTWNLMGGAAAIDAGDVSSLSALAISVDMLLAHDCDMMICAAGQRRMSLPEYETLAIQGVLADGQPRPPVDALGGGYVPGEGVVVVLLKRLADAQRDGDKIHSIIRGIGGAHSDSFAEAMQLAMERSLVAGGGHPADIGVMELDATGSRAAADEELRVIAELHEKAGRKSPLLVSSVSSQIGHTQGAAGLASLLKASLELNHGEVPPTFGLTSPAPLITQKPNVLQAVTTRTAMQMTGGRRAAAVASWSRGMIYHAILQYGSPVPEPQPATTGQPVAAVVDTGDLESFLINFVVEQTGYPPEVVELDADLEADLGIDSIKKAQLFGELQEYFDVTPTDELTLDDFPTLRHVMNFLAQSTGQSAPQSPVAEPTPAPAAATTTALDTSDLESFLINFVVEQTGYPAEVVELDADLEADLGIDSIKKAQLFGELQEYFDVTPTDDLTLDDFPTLRHVVKFLARSSTPTENVAAAPAQEPSTWRIYRAAGNSQAEIQSHIAAALADPASAYQAAKSKNPFSPADAQRLAVICSDADSLAHKLRTAQTQLGNAASRQVLEQQGIFHREVPAGGSRIAFVFPGQGSQYIGMLKEIVHEIPAAAEAVRELDATLTRLGRPSFAEIAWNANSPLGTDVWSTQVSMLLADAVMFAVLTDRGIQPDLMLGHSYGEYAALLCAEAWDLEQALNVTRARTDGIEACASAQGGMLATSATPEFIETLARQLSEPVYAANLNAPDQTVVGGRRDVLAQLEPLLRVKSHHARLLPVPCPFHTPLMQESIGPLDRALQAARIQPPRVTTYSVANNQPVLSADDVRRNLVAHMTTPVRYQELIASIASEAPTVFVEVGPQQALTRLNARILADDGLGAIACDNPKRPGQEQLLAVQALLEVCGATDDRRPQVKASAAPRPAAAEIMRFDATERRRTKMRAAAQGEKPPVEAPAPARPTAPGGNGSPYPAPTVAKQLVSAPAPSPAEFVSETSAQISSATATAAVLDSPVKTASVETDDLESFLINFVVDQTGYPPEVVELDADLEADLGIDSIKKAQLFGELQEYFDITATADLTLDDFPTLRHVMNFLAGASAPPAPAPTPAPVAEATPPPAAAPAADTSDLESFLINFVVEQTGYPAEVVELDADLEADLGIDSIKKAQLFGELQEYFDITATDDLTLDDFPTLRHVMDFLSGATATPGEPTSDLAAPPQPAEDPQQLKLRGTPYEMGREHGARMRQEIRRALRRIADLGEDDFVGLSMPPWIDRPEQHLAAEVYEELRGLADGVEVPVGNILALNLIVAAQSGTTDDLCLPGGLRECLTPVVQLRKSDGAASSPTFTFAGLVGGLDEVKSLFEHREPVSRPAFDQSAEVMQTHRFVMRLLAVPLDAGANATFQATGPAVILGRNPDADALREQLARLGVTVHQLAANSIDEAVGAIDRLWKEQPVAHMFLMVARDQEQEDLGDPAAWARCVDRQVLLPFYLCQRWLQLAHDAKIIDRCTLVASTDLGGDFGFSGNVTSPQSGALTGLMKAMCLEYHVMRGHEGFLAKAIDVPRSERPDRLAESICRELAARTIDYEIAFVGGTRYLQIALPKPAQPQQFSEVRPGGTWVVTGGARGIGAASALELCARFGLKLHLIGTSRAAKLDPAWRDLDEEQLANLRSRTIVEARQRGEKPNEAWDRVQKAIEIDSCLRRFADSGIAATYHACDVADREALAAVLKSIRQADGPIEGILHAAGIERPSRFEKKSAEIVMATLGAKVLGAYNLMSLTREDPVRHFIGYGSISGRMGSNGQADYCVASDMLSKLVSWYHGQRPDCHAVAFHWHPWDEVGMAARPENRAMLERTKGPKLMPKREGLRHLTTELFSLPSDSEVLITDWDYHQRYYGNNVQDVAELVLRDVPSARIASRNVMRMHDAPLRDAAGSPLQGHAAILGNNPAAAALREQLDAKGVMVSMLAVEDDPAKTVAALEAAWAKQPIRYLLLMTPHEAAGRPLLERAAIEERQARGVYLPYAITQRWFQLVSEQMPSEQAVIAAATNLGGAFGFQGHVPAPEGGALCGLLKSIFVEDARSEPRKFLVKLIDSPPEEDVRRLAEAIAREVAAGDSEVEVAWAGGRRQVVRCHVEPVEDLPRADLKRGGVWIVTGGARGITAAAAKQLGKEYGLKLHLVGKSPAPEPDAPWRDVDDDGLKKIKRSIVMKAVSEGRSPEDDWDRVRKDREIHRTLAEFAASGVDVTYHSCDVTDWDGMDRLLEQIRAADGPIEGVIHGAGYAKSARFETRGLDRAQRTIDPKVRGTLALMALTRQDPLKYFIGFGSLSGRFGGNGLSDYAAANDMLAKLCDWFRGQRPDCHTACFHWQTWDEVGMAMLADGVGITKNAFKMDFIPPPEGVEHLHQELRAGLPEGEVLITDGFFQRTFYPGELTAIPAARTARPLIDSVEGGPATGQLRAVVKFQPATDPFLVEHRLKNKPFLPGVVGLESVLEAASLWQPDRPPRALRDVEIVNGLMFHTDQPISTHVSVTPQGNALECRLTSELRDRQGRVIDPERLHVRATVDLEATGAITGGEGPGRPPLGWFPNQYPDDGLLYHGPPLRCLKQVAYQYDGGWGQIVAPDASELAGPRSAEGWLLPLAVLDACVVSCGSFVFLQFGGQLEVPHGFANLRWTALPRSGETCVVRIYFRSRDDRHSHFDFTLYGEDERPLLEATGYRTVRVGGGS